MTCQITNKEKMSGLLDIRGGIEMNSHHKKTAQDREEVSYSKNIMC
jgi:hypothetical protein